MTVKAGQQMQMRFAPATGDDAKVLMDKPEGYIAGWASTSTIDEYGTIVAKGAFAESLRTKPLTGPKSIKLLLDHDYRKLAGVIHKLEYRGNGLWIEAQLNLKVSYVHDAYHAAKMVGGTNFSVRWFTETYTVDEKSGVYTITKGDLREISMVVDPGNVECEMTDIRSNDSEPADTMAAFERRLITLGYAESRNEARRLTQEVKRHASLFQSPGATPEVVPGVTPPPVSADHQALAALLETFRSTTAALVADAGKTAPRSTS